MIGSLTHKLPEQTPGSTSSYEPQRVEGVTSFQCLLRIPGFYIRHQ